MEAAALGEWFCEKEGCKREMFSVEEIVEWGGTVVAIKASEEGLLYQVNWSDGSAPVWVDEGAVPHKLILEFRAEREKQQRNKVAKKLEAQRKKKKEVKKTSPKPAKSPAKSPVKSPSKSPPRIKSPSEQPCHDALDSVEAKVAHNHPWSKGKPNCQINLTLRQPGDLNGVERQPGGLLKRATRTDP